MLDYCCFLFRLWISVYVFTREFFSSISSSRVEFLIFHVFSLLSPDRSFSHSFSSLFWWFFPYNNFRVLIILCSPIECRCCLISRCSVGFFFMKCWNFRNSRFVVALWSHAQWNSTRKYTGWFELLIIFFFFFCKTNTCTAHFYKIFIYHIHFELSLSDITMPKIVIKTLRLNIAMKGRSIISPTSNKK